MLLPVCIPYTLPHLRDLGQPCPALRKKAVAGLLLSSPHHQYPVIIRLTDLILQIRANRRMAG